MVGKSDLPKRGIKRLLKKEYFEKKSKYGGKRFLILILMIEASGPYRLDSILN